MKQVARKSLNLEEYQCRSCKRSFYIDVMDISSLDLDLGCPYGCDASGKHIRDINTEIRNVIERGE